MSSVELREKVYNPETGGITENSLIQYKKVRNYYIYFSFNDSVLRVVAVSHVKRSSKYIKALLE